MAQNEIGAIIDSGAQDWQIFQQNKQGTANIELAGHWITQNKHTNAVVYARVMDENNYLPVCRSLEWQAAETKADGSWSITLPAVPCGGLYRIETVLRLDNRPFEWAQRGDMIHHIGVGDVWVIAGQSNAAGYGKSPAQDAPELGVHVFRANGSWALGTQPLNDGTGTKYPANREGTNPSQSPFLSFGKKLKAALGYPIGLIPTALGGSSLSSWVKSVEGRLFHNMMEYIKDAKATPCGMCWYQGCSDADPNAAKLYFERFKEFVADVRAELKNPALPIITAQINRVIGQSNYCWEDIRETQRQCARQIPGVYVISTLDLGLSDGIHNNSSSNIIIGLRMANIALSKVYERDVKCLHPDLESARLVDKSKVELTFANIDIRLALEDGAADHIPFALRDEDGENKIARCYPEKANTIILELSREVKGKAKAIGAPGACPPFMMPFDLAGYLPMLGFTADVE